MTYLINQCKCHSLEKFEQPSHIWKTDEALVKKLMSYTKARDAVLDTRTYALNYVYQKDPDGTVDVVRQFKDNIIGENEFVLGTINEYSFEFRAAIGDTYHKAEIAKPLHTVTDGETSTDDFFKTISTVADELNDLIPIQKGSLVMHYGSQSITLKLHTRRMMVGYVKRHDLSQASDDHPDEDNVHQIWRVSEPGARIIVPTGEPMYLTGGQLIWGARITNNRDGRPYVEIPNYTLYMPKCDVVFEVSENKEVAEDLSNLKYIWPSRGDYAIDYSNGVGTIVTVLGKISQKYYRVEALSPTEPDTGAKGDPPKSSYLVTLESLFPLVKRGSVDWARWRYYAGEEEKSSAPHEMLLTSDIVFNDDEKYPLDLNKEELKGFNTVMAEKDVAALSKFSFGCIMHWI